MKRAVAVVAMLAWSGFASAEKFLVFGFGTSSCGRWLSSRADEYEGNVWILGFWSGLNHGRIGGSDTGASTDAHGILAEIKKRCQADPSRNLAEQTAQLYNEFRDAGR